MAPSADRVENLQCQGAGVFKKRAEKISGTVEEEKKEYGKERVKDGA